MPPKPRSKPKKMHESSQESEVSQESEIVATIAKIHEKKQKSKKILYLIEWTDKPNKAQWQWNEEKELQKIKGWKDLLQIWQKKQNTKEEQMDIEPEQSKTRKKIQIKPNKEKSLQNSLEKSLEKSLDKSFDRNQDKSKEHKKPIEKSQTKPSIGSVKKIPIDQQVLKQKILAFLPSHQQKVQQGSLDGFVNKISTSQAIVQQKDQAKITGLLLSSLSLKLSKENNHISLQKPIEKVSNSSVSFLATDKNYQSYLSKIKGIRNIKGFRIIDNEIQYEVDAFDQNGQTLFLPYLRSEDLMRLDKQKLAVFMNECLIRGIYQEQQKRDNEENREKRLQDDRSIDKKGENKEKSRMYK